jgi:ribosomal protein S18 acetylase RimI-like enzyme
MADVNIHVQWASLIDEDTADGIVSLIDCAVQDGGALGYSAPLTPDEAEGFLDHLQQRIWSGDAHLLLGRAAGAPVMMVVMQLNAMHNCRHRAEICKGIVHPAYRGRGLVEVGIRRVAEKAVALGVEQLVIDVREGSRAHALWRHFGFATYGVLEDYARIAGQRCRGHYMVQDVAALRLRLGRAEAAVLRS